VILIRISRLGDLEVGEGKLDRHSDRNDDLHARWVSNPPDSAHDADVAAITGAAILATP
jgi:hypothetical protein